MVSAADLVVRLSGLQVELDVLASSDPLNQRPAIRRALQRAAEGVAVAVGHALTECDRQAAAEESPADRRARAARADGVLRLSAAPPVAAAPAVTAEVVKPAPRAPQQLAHRPPPATARYYCVTFARQGYEGQADGVVGLYSRLRDFREAVGTLEDVGWIGRGHFAWAPGVQGFGFQSIREAEAFWHSVHSTDEVVVPCPRHF